VITAVVHSSPARTVPDRQRVKKRYPVYLLAKLFMVLPLLLAG